ncbi:hypothetical protein ACLMJK_001229 [Lecanora helva]
MGPETQNGDAEQSTFTNERSKWQDEEDHLPEASTPGSSDMDIRSLSSSQTEGNRSLPLPVWMRESSKSFHWRWVPLPIRHAARAVVKWSKGPDPPQIQKITPFFPFIQEAPAKFIDKHLPKRRHKAALLAFFYFCWLLTFILVLNHSAKAGNIKGYGKPASVWCGATFWNMDNECGLNGNRCRPFDNATLAFRCPANCKSLQVLEPHAVGAQQINYQPYVIGGPTASEENSTIPDTVYRGDSFICQAAIHAGLVGNDKGGCGVALLAGDQTNFTSTKRHGIQSIAFDSSFPKSFTFMSGLSSECVRDLRWPLLAVTCGFTTILSLCTTSPPVLFASIFTMLFFHVGLVSDPPNHSDYASLTSLIIGRFLPAAFVAFVIYRYSVKPQQTNLTANIERTILWLGGAWFGSLNNYTFYHLIPIQRLTPSDIQSQPGAKLALVLVVLLIFSIALGQVWYLRLEGLFRRYLAIYALFVAFLLFCVALPQLSLRIHHYFLALLLLPGTRPQTRPGLLYQGILIGLFVNGVARWGFDSIMQTTFELRGPGPFDPPLPNVTVPAVATSNITFAWSRPPQPYDGLSVLVNDVERHRWYYGEGDGPVHTFFRPDEKELEKQYFRFGYMRGSQTAKFTEAGVWGVDGSFRDIPD